MTKQVVIKGTSFNVVNSVRKEDYDSFLGIIISSFKKMSDEGQSSTCSRYTVEDFENKLIRNCYFAIYTSDFKPVAIASCEIKKDAKYAHMVVCAVHPEYQAFGLGTILFNECFESACKFGCYYAISDTSELNKVSIKWHQKNLGYSLYGYNSYTTTNYYSYEFRKDCINRGWLFKNFLYPCRFCMKYVFIKCQKNADGTLTTLGKIIKQLR